MNQTQSTSQLKVTRRGLLKWMLAGSAAVVGGYVLSEYSPWLDYESQAEKTWAFLYKSESRSDQMRALVHYATLAASGHNTQPWKFALKPDAIEIHPDYSRRLDVVDPEHRELWISLGCALENLLLSARAYGLATEVTYPDTQEYIRVRISSGIPEANLLFEAIPLRQNTRSEFSGEMIQETDLQLLQALPVEPGIRLRFISQPEEMETVLDYVNRGNLAQYADRGFLDELIHWLRFNKREAFATLDGLYSPCSGNPEVPRLVGEVFVNSTNPRQQAETDAKKLRSSSAAVVIASDVEDRSAWVRTGQVYERLALTLTTMNIKSAFLNQPVEVKELRTEFRSALNLGQSMPQLLLRLGYAEALPRSLRRSVDQVVL